MNAQKKIYFPNLDGCRTVAFLMVFLGHCTSFFDFGEKTKVINYLNKIFGNPEIGVNFFFVLSGFLISYLILSENEKFKKIDIKAFYIRRILRIWPVYFTVVFIAILLSFIHRAFYSLHNVSFWMIGLFLTNLKIAYTGISSLPIVILWSVAVEEQFYLLLPLLIVVFTRKVFYLFPLFIAGSILFRYLLAKGYGHGVPLWGFHTISVCSSLFVGCLIAYLTLFHNFSKIFIHLNRIFILFTYGCFLVFHLYRDTLFSFQNGRVWLFFIYSLFFAFFIMEQNYAERSFYKMSKIKLFTAWGKYTYGLYAYHMIFASLLMVMIPQYINPKGNYFIYFSLWAVALAATFLCARLSYIYMEKPFLKLKNKFSRL